MDQLGAVAFDRSSHHLRNRLSVPLVKPEDLARNVVGLE